MMVALAGLIAVGLAAFGSATFLWKREAQIPPAAGAKPPAAQSTTARTDDYDWLVQAMAECEAKAEKNLAALYFLIIPMAPTGQMVPGWSPATIGDLGTRGVLVPGTDALIGLRNGAFALYKQPLTFAASDPATQTVYKWKPAVGVTELSTRETNIASLKLGFQIGDGPDIEWGPTIAIKTGSCYWTNPLIWPARN